MVKILDEWMRRLRELVGSIVDDHEGARARQLLRAVLAEMERRSQKLLSATWAPDRYVVFLHPSDLEVLGPLARAVQEELAEQVRRHVSRRGYRMAGDVDLELGADESLERGEVRVEAMFVGEPGEEPPPPADSPAAPPSPEGAEAPAVEKATRLLEPERETRLRVREWQLEVVDGPEAGRRIAVGTRPVTVGRGRDADVRLQDPSEYLSRVHARFQVEEEGHLVVEDLGSANGTLLDGRKIERETLRGEALVQVGDVTLRCIPPAEDA